MLVLTEEQRLKALDACERIEKANANLQRIAEEAMEGLEKLKQTFPAPLSPKE